MRVTNLYIKLKSKCLKAYFDHNKFYFYVAETIDF